MTRSAGPGLTAEELFARADYEHYELASGALQVSEPPGGVHGLLAARLSYRLHGFVQARGLGVVLVEAGYVLRRNPDTVRGPDVSFVSTATLRPDQIPKTFIPCAPDLAVEILSPEDRRAHIAEKVADYLDAGTKLVWVIDPSERQLIVHRPDRPPRVAAAQDSLDGEDVLPGFRWPLTELFG